MREWNPSYDFRLFDIGWASPLQANEFGAATSFRASDPTAFVDRSLNQLRGLLDPRAAYPFAQNQLPVPLEDIPFTGFFQGGAETTRERLRRVRDEADRLLSEAGGNSPQSSPQGGAAAKQCDTTKCHWWERLLGKRDGECCHKITRHDGDTSTVETEREREIKDMVRGSAQDWLGALPAGAGVFLIAVIALVFILLFVRK